MAPVLRKGKLTSWKDDRGFGFIKPDQGGQDVFLHISALKNAKRRPQAGDVIVYQLTSDNSGKVRAYNASIEGVFEPVAKRELTSRSSLFWVEALLLSSLPMLGAFNFALTNANLIPLILYPGMSLLTFLLYVDDKLRAKQGKWRIPENTLHLCELAGGWIGAFIAQRKIRHKSSKRSYQMVFWTIVVVHIAFWLDWFFLNKTLMKLFFRLP